MAETGLAVAASAWGVLMSILAGIALVSVTVRFRR
jgi:hypothetical protein